MNNSAWDQRAVEVVKGNAERMYVLQLCINSIYNQMLVGLRNDYLPLSYPNDSLKCAHEIKQYTGFTESYSYCTKCDEKVSK